MENRKIPRIKCDGNMKGIPILIAFFVIFTSASLLIANPMFPGSFIQATLNDSFQGYGEFVEAMVNGVFYGMIFWLVFVGISKKLEKEE